MPTKFDDQAVITRCLAGDQEAWRLLVEKYNHSVFLTCRLLVGPAAPDAVQETFIRVFTGLHTYEARNDAKFSTWLFTVARHTAIDVKAKRGVVAEFHNDFPIAYKGRTAFDQIATEEYTAIVHNALALIHPTYRKVLKLYLAGKSCSKIADIMDLPLTTIDSRLARAKKALREAFEKMGVADTLMLEFNEKLSARRRKKFAWRTDPNRPIRFADLQGIPETTEERICSKNSRRYERPQEVRRYA